MQIEIALSSTESEHTSLSYTLREAIPLIYIIREINYYSFNFNNSSPKVLCKVFEDNSGILEISMVYKYWLHTKYLNVKLHYFRDYVERGNIIIEKIVTTEKRADFLTKPEIELVLVKLRCLVMG